MQNISVIMLIFILIAVVTAVLVYYLIYKRNINRRLQQGNYDEEPGKKRMADWHEVALVVAVIGVILCFMNLSSQISGLKNVIMNLENQVQNISISMEENMGELKDQQEKQNSSLEAVTLRYGTFHKEDHTAEITFQVTPKELAKNAKVYLSIKDQQIKLEQKGQASFEGTARLDIFGNYVSEDFVCTIVSEDGMRKTEILNPEGAEGLVDGCLWQNYLPEMEPSVDEDDIEWKDGKVNVKMSGVVYPNIGKESEDMLQGMKLCVSIDDQVVDQKELQIGEEVNFSLEESYEMKSTQTLSFYLEATDSYGFRYVVSVEEWGDDVHTAEVGMHIYDAEGNLMREDF